MTTTAQRTADLVDLIIDDHRDVEAVFTELEQGGQSPEQRKQLVDHVIANLVRHSVAEEQLLYPTARKVLPDGDEVADHEIKEHAEAEQTMKRLEQCEPNDQDFERQVTELIAAIRHHVEEEESTLLPQIKANCPNEQLTKLGDHFEKAKKIAPTRPHPSAPDTPPANLVLDPGAAIIDKVRDTLCGREV